MRNQHFTVGASVTLANRIHSLIYIYAHCLIAPRFRPHFNVCLLNIEGIKCICGDWTLYFEWIVARKPLILKCHSNSIEIQFLNSTIFHVFKLTFHFPRKITEIVWLFNTGDAPKNYNCRQPKWVIEIEFHLHATPQNNDLNTALWWFSNWNDAKLYRCKSAVIRLVDFGTRTTNSQITTVADRSTNQTESWGLIEASHKQPSLNSTIGLALRFHAFRTQVKRERYDRVADGVRFIARCVRVNKTKTFGKRWVEGAAMHSIAIQIRN